MTSESSSGPGFGSEDIVEYDRRSEEWANFLTHALGTVMSVIGVAALLSASTDDPPPHRIAYGVYGATLTAVYAASALSHLFQSPRLRHFFRVLDQAFIYLLIVGTYTPTAVVYLHGGALDWLFRSMWVVALAGFLSKAIWHHRVEAISVVVYVALGWMPIIGIGAAYERLPTLSFQLFLAGGVLYTVGVTFLLNDHRVRYFHMTWHLFVMAASLCHFIAVLLYTL